MKRLLLTASAALLLGATNAQFHSSIGSPSGGMRNFGYAVINTTDGGYLFVGGNPFYNNGDIFVVKTTASGTVSWQRHYGTTADVDFAACAVQLTDGNYVVAGSTMPFPAGTTKGYIVKINASTGAVMWSRTLNSNTSINDIVANSDGTFTAVGGYQTDVMVVKMSTFGTLSLQRVYNLSTGGETGNSIRPTDDGGYIISGSIDPDLDPYQKALLLKITSTGTFSWAKGFYCYGLEPGCFATAHSADMATETSDGGYIMVAHASGCYSDNRQYVIKTTSTGTFSWSQVYGAAGTHYAGTDILETSAGDFITSDYAGVLIKMNSAGSVQWTKKYHGEIYDMLETSTGDLVFTGATSAISGNNDMYMVKTNSLGVCCAELANTVTAYPHTTTTATFTGTTTTPITLVTPTTVSGTSTAAVASKCTCPVNAGSDKHNEQRNSCCTPSGCTGVVIGTASSGYTYSWSPATALSCTNCAQPTASPCASQTYTLTVSGASCIAATDAVTVTTVFVDCCGPKRLAAPGENESFVTIYPNPTQGSLVIGLPEDAATGLAVTIEVVDQLGRQVMTQEGNSDTKRYSIDLSGQAKGLYIVNVTIGTETTTQKIVLE